MNPVTEFYLFSAVIWASLIAGIAARHRRPSVARAARPLLQLNVVLFPPIAFFVGFWNLDLDAHGWRLLLVPVIATTVSLVTLGAGKVMADRWNLPPRRRGAFIACAAIGNIGLTFGLPVCFALFGLDGFSLGALYVLYFPFFVFLILFTLADRLRRQAAGHDTSADTFLPVVIAFFRDPFRVVPIVALMAGFAANLWGGREALPDWLKTVNHVALYLSLLVAYLAIGFTIHAGALRDNARAIVAIVGIKFVLAPLVCVPLALALGFQGQPLAVLAIQSGCPVATFAVVTAAIYRLDEELAGAALIVTTAVATVAALVTLPLL